MAVPTYTTDLVTLAIGSISVDTGIWDESSDAGWDTGGAMVDDANLYYNGTACVSAQLTKDSIGTGIAGPATILYTHGSSFTVPVDGAILVHHLWAAPPALLSLSSGGVGIIVGNTAGDFYNWSASGNDFAPAPRGGWANYAINPAIGSPLDTVGTPTGVWNTVGMSVRATAQARGNPNAVNAIRYGRCISEFTGGDASNGYATFAGFATVDDAPSAKWNLVEPVEGGYKIQGLMSLGLSATAVDFRDSNANITIRNTINVTSAFNRIEVHNLGSNVEWTAINMTALGTVSKCQFEAIDNATISKTSCTFTDMDSFIYQSNSTIISSIYRRCGLITQGGATYTSCTFDKPSGAVCIASDNLNLITKCNFNSSGTGHAIDLGVISSDTTYTYDNTDTSYAPSNGSTGNETIKVNVDAGITLTINVSSGASTPTINNVGTGTVNVLAGLVSLTMSGHPIGATIIVYDLDSADPQDLGTELFRANSANLSEQYSYSGGKSGDDVWIKCLHNGYKIFGKKLTLPSNNSSFDTTLTQETN